MEVDMFDPFKDQKTLWPSDIIIIINCILIDMGKLGVKESFALKIFQSRKLKNLLKSLKILLSMKISILSIFP